jgi:hypothetical protein
MDLNPKTSGLNEFKCTPSGWENYGQGAGPTLFNLHSLGILINSRRLLQDLQKGELQRR